jgi:viroplasmin and RNaseH domain-containing protein
MTKRKSQLQPNKPFNYLDDNNPRYVVWVGRKPGIYSNWASCAEQVLNFPKARFKKFPNLPAAKEAFQQKTIKEAPVSCLVDEMKDSLKRLLKGLK